jgi:hypothetical protein
MLDYNSIFISNKALQHPPSARVVFTCCTPSSTIFSAGRPRSPGLDDESSREEEFKSDVLAELNFTPNLSDFCPEIVHFEPAGQQLGLRWRSSRNRTSCSSSTCRPSSRSETFRSGRCTCTVPKDARLLSYRAQIPFLLEENEERSGAPLHAVWVPADLVEKKEAAGHYREAWGPAQSLHALSSQLV